MPASPIQISQPPPKCHDHLAIANLLSKSPVVFIMAAASSTIDRTNIEILTFQRSTIESHKQMVVETTALEVALVVGKVDLNIATATTRIRLVNTRRRRITETRKLRQLLLRRLMKPMPPATLISSPRRISLI